jgi:tRNA G18 (ribose-2'-O)-methylase SpoU
MVTLSVLNDVCKFRFPLYEQRTDNLKCPSCKSPVYIVSTNEVQADPVPQEKKFTYNPIEALLDNIRSALNVGSMFRTADGFGLRHLYLCGMTPTPIIKSVAKTSLGAEKYIRWTYEKNSVEQVYKLEDSS